MYRTVAIGGIKGGVGTTTCVSMLAVELARRAETVIYVDGAVAADFPAVMGVPAVETLMYRVEGTPTGANITPHKGEFPNQSIVLVDKGTCGTDSADVVVVANDYLSLRRYAAHHPPGRVVLVLNESRPLNLVDCTDVMGVLPIAVIRRTDHLARMLDAGVLANRYSRVPLDVRQQLALLADVVETLRVP